MGNSAQTLSAFSVINDVIPKLNAVEKLVESTVDDTSVLAQANQIPQSVLSLLG
ncbi:hypothetical protein [Halomonas hibernica]|uniref:hypothetical protein n=1 Tax=Halomonas hibernica TaxID=2591147 RepID=UPI001554ABC5|nr:hypothetical protein [Halomonas hibernica]